MKLAIVIALLLPAVKADNVLREESRPGIRQKAVEVNPGAFSEVYVERLCRLELERKPRVNFLQLQVFGDRGGPPLPKPNHVTYTHWRDLHTTLARSPNEFAEMISIGGNAVLRFHDQDGNVSKRVIAGRNPLQLDIRGGRYEIIHLAFSPQGPYTVQRVDVYVRTSAELQPVAGLDLLQVLGRILPNLELSVYVRNDGWFIYEPSFPFAHPFEEDQRIPTEEEHKTTRTLRCGYWTGSPSCTF